MSCPFGYGSSLQQTQALEQKMKEREAAGGEAAAPAAAAAASEASSSTPVKSPMLPSNGTGSPAGSVSAAPGVILPPLHSGARPRLPFSLFTGGVRTSLGVENAHPISVWMKEMQSRGGLKGIDIEKELLGFEGAVGPLDGPVQSQTQLQALDEIAAQQAQKNWKEKRERPPAVLDASTIPLASPTPGSSDGSQGPTHPAHLHLYPGMFSGRINHNASKHIPMANKYDQEITYWNYIHPEALTCLQNGRQGKGLNNPDEHLFILVHQVFELWFKQILWELEFVRNFLISYEDPWLPKHDVDSNPILRCVQRLNRSDKIMRLATEGYGVMETMNPGDFLMFRDFLSPSSGFQSVQLRELEILLGLKDEERISCAGRHYREAFMANGENKTNHFDTRLSEFSIKDSLYVYLRRHVPTSNLDQFLAAYFEVINTQNDEKSKDFEEELSLLEKMMGRTGDAREQAYLKDLTEKAKFGRTLARNSSEDVKMFFKDPLLGVQRTSILFLFTYHTHPKLAATSELVSGMLAFEQAVLLWRQRHARMVESFIGRRPGTGGSSGVEYIDATAAQYRIFTDIWRIRSLCVARSKINFDPDNGAVWPVQTEAKTNMKEVEEGIRAETQAIKDRAREAAVAEGLKSVDLSGSMPSSLLPAVTAQALHVHHPGATAPSHRAADGPLANSTTSIAAGIGPGAAVGQNAV